MRPIMPVVLWEMRIDWPALIEDMQQVILGEMTPFERQMMSVTCKTYYNQWYDLAASTGFWMGKHVPTLHGLLKAPPMKEIGILKGLVEARRFDVIRRYENQIHGGLIETCSLQHIFHYGTSTYIECLNILEYAADSNYTLAELTCLMVPNHVTVATMVPHSSSTINAANLRCCVTSRAMIRMNSGCEF